MHALRAGLKRIDNKKNKEKRLLQTSSRSSTDGSSLPILNFRDLNETSPAKAPISWEPNSLQDDLVSTENLTIGSGRFQAQHNLHESTDPHTEGTGVFRSIEKYHGEDSAINEPVEKYDENIPPLNNRSMPRTMKISKWKQVMNAGESRQPLLVESIANSSKTLHGDRSTHPRNPSRWEPIELDDRTEPPSRRRTNYATDHVSSRRVVNFDAQVNNISWKQKHGPKRDESSEETGLKKYTTQRIAYARATFDPFGNDEFEREDNSQQRHEFASTSTNDDSRSTENVGINRVQQRNQKVKNFQQSTTFRELNEGDTLSSSEIVGRASQLKDRSVIEREFIGGEVGHSKQNKCVENGEDCAKNCLRSFKVEKEPLVTEIQETQESKDCIQSLGMDSNLKLQREHIRENEFHKNEIHRKEENLKCSSVQKQPPFPESLENKKDVGDSFTEICGEQYELERKANTRPIHESNHLRADSEFQQNAEQSSEAVEENGNKIGLRLVVLLSKFSGTLQQRTEQERAISILKGRNISNIEEVDGSSQCNKVRRNSLFEISGDRGKYPQFFLQKDPNIIIYLGDFEWLQYMNDIGSLTDETIFGVTHSESTKIEVTDSTSDDVSEHNIEALNDHTTDLSFSDRALAFDIYKKEQLGDFSSPKNKATNVAKLRYAEKETNCLDFKMDEVVMSSKPKFSSKSTSPTDIESYSIPMPKKETKVVDVEEIEHSKDFTDIYNSTAGLEESESYTTPCESVISGISDQDAAKMQNSFTETISGAKGIPMTRACVFEQSVVKSGQNDSQCIIEEPSTEQTQEESNFETISSIPSSELHENGRRATFAFDEEFSDSESEPAKTFSSCSSSSPTKSEMDLKLQNSPTKPSTMCGEEKINLQAMEADKSAEIYENEIDIPFDRKGEIESTCSDLEKPEPSRVVKDEKHLKEMASQERRRQRWKRRIIAENLRAQSDDKTSSRKKERPIGASLDEIEMINIFMTVLGPDFDGSLSSQELEGFYRRARKAGLTKEFTNRMLSQSTGIHMRDTDNESDIANRQPSNTAESPTVLNSDESYDDHDFTRKTPKTQSKFDCLVETFWAESSNIVGCDMIENVQAALSRDGESTRTSRTIDSSDRKSRWRPADMIENIKASLSGDTSEGGWQSSDVIGNIKAALSGESENLWSPDNSSANVHSTGDAADAIGNDTLHEC